MKHDHDDSMNILKNVKQNNPLTSQQVMLKCLQIHVYATESLQTNAFINVSVIRACATIKGQHDVNMLMQQRRTECNI